ncbi:hypothetical protein [Verrucomicrobium spinosum]|uniref:hypothetical protein n=1 Tax=Verrucomicrobium spinosum TaxID=2736 RepID=UPI000A92F9E7|nr:hypothetical protein [Verrucomicrobium spinosum]
MIFYGWWNPWFVLLMLGTTALDYNLGSMIANADKLKERGGTDEDVQRRKKLGVVLSVTSNLAALAFFKYTAFAVDSVQASPPPWGGAVWQCPLSSRTSSCRRASRSTFSRV